MRYACFLRGVNSGKNPPLKMDKLREAFEEMGFTDVKTVIASGNVIFDSQEGNLDLLEIDIEQKLPDKIGFKTGAFVHSISEFQALFEQDPFGAVDMTSQIKPYVTFTKTGARVPLTLPYEGNGFTILKNYHGIVCSIVDFSTAGTPQLMKVLDKELGKENTTRAWKTVEKVVGI